MKLDTGPGSVIREFKKAHRAYDTLEQDYSTIEECDESGLVITPPDSHESSRVSLSVAEERYEPVRIPGLID